MKSKSSQPTMKDVAREAGVALGTVSKVFNGIPVGRPYKEKVEAAAKKLGYRVNNYARGMRTNRTNTVGIIMPELTHPFFAALTEYICRELNERNLRAYIALTHWNAEEEKRCIGMVVQNKADGIIALTYNPCLDEMMDVPFISIDRPFGGTTPCISSDNYSGGQIAAEKLHALGSQKLLHIRAGSSVSSETDKRRSGFEAYCQKHNIPYDVFYYNEDGETKLFEKIRAMLEAKTFGYDGVFASTDLLAVQMMQLLQSYNVRIPEDVQIIGFDGVKDFFTGEYVCSTILQPLELLAKTAVTALLSMDKDISPNLICLPVSYAKGKTTRD